MGPDQGRRDDGGTYRTSGHTVRAWPQLVLPTASCLVLQGTAFALAPLMACPSLRRACPGLCLLALACPAALVQDAKDGWDARMAPACFVEPFVEIEALSPSST
ncbi:hypothetical protein Trihar35433_9589 [Trichoderma harzianum]|nr:hypothetical protein Trihar35433_9589 [Trichoderma harzianum]